MDIVAKAKKRFALLAGGGPSSPSSNGGSPTSPPVAAPAAPAPPPTVHEDIATKLECPDTAAVDIDGLRRLCWFGCPARLRLEAWSHLLGYFPPTRQQRAPVVERKRAEYASFVERHYANVDWDGLLDRNSSFSGVSRMDTVAVGNEDLATMRQIRKDVPRTATGVALLVQPEVQAMLERTLFTWAVRHPASGYVQGMNDLFLPFLYVVFADRLVPDTSNVAEIFEWDGARVRELFQQLDARAWAALEADVYWLASSFLSAVQDHFAFSQTGTHAMVQKLECIITTTDPAFRDHLRELNINFPEFAFRWMNCLLLRELSPLQAIRLWDTYLCEEKDFADFHIYFCAVLLRRWGATLIHCTDFVSVMSYLQNPNTKELTERDLSELVSQAFLLQQLYQPTLGKLADAKLAMSNGSLTSLGSPAASAPNMAQLYVPINMALAEELKSEIDEVFRMFDEDDSGSIDAGELASALYTITGEHIPREEALAVMQKYDQDSNGGIDRNEFEAMVLERMKGRSFQEETTRAFKLLEDKDMPGFVTKDSIRAVAAEAGEKLSEAEITEMFDVIVTGQQTPAVDFPTFCSIQYAAENAEDH